MSHIANDTALATIDLQQLSAVTGGGWKGTLAKWGVRAVKATGTAIAGTAAGQAVGAGIGAAREGAENLYHRVRGR